MNDSIMTNVIFCVNPDFFFSRFALFSRNSFYSVPFVPFLVYFPALYVSFGEHIVMEEIYIVSCVSLMYDRRWKFKVYETCFNFLKNLPVSFQFSSLRLKLNSNFLWADEKISNKFCLSYKFEQRSRYTEVCYVCLLIYFYLR